MNSSRKTLRTVAGLGLFAVGAMIGFASCRGTRDSAPPPRVVDHVDIERYLGKWYEIASFPQRFQRGCVATTAEYSLKTDGELAVVNTCRKDALDGEIKRVEGKAFVVDPQTNAKLKVQFFWPFRGDYWILELGDDYEYAVVGSPDRDSLWILNREPRMDPETYAGILKRFERRGWDVDRLQRTVQPPG
jgi:apolipoprotein D and lipocalin family protein